MRRGDKVTVIKCPDCGKEQEDSHRFCKNCGANLENIKKEVPKLNLSTDFEKEKTDIHENIVKKIENEEEKDQIKKEIISPKTETIADKNISTQTENIKKCSKCGQELKNEKFCPKCEQSTASVVPYESKEKTCPSCGYNISTEKFCPNCGQKQGEVHSNVHNILQKYCRNCGSQIDAKAEICPKCGVRQLAVESHKNPVVSLVLSFIFPGLGQIYNNQNHKGIYLIIGYLVSWVLTLFIIGLLLVVLIWVYGMYDAFTTAQAINRGEFVEDKLF